MISEIQFIPSEIHVDERGDLIEIIRHSQGLLSGIAQLNLINDPVRGTIKAWHKHFEMREAFFCSHGKVKFGLYDDREESNTYKEINTFVFGERKPSVLVVPPGVYHGHIALQDDTQIIAVCSHEYNRETPDEERIPYDSFDYDWEVAFK